MKIGLIARAENRGLGTMCWEFSRHMEPDKTLVVIPEGVRHAHLTSHLERYPDAAVTTPLNGNLNENQCREWLDGLDVVYTAETFYDWRFCRWADEAHVATVCHVMPEWFNPAWSDAPTQWWAPTSWRLDRLPEGTKVVPVPIATDRFTPSPRADGPFRWLHMAGAKTHYDRNGTCAVLDAARALTRPQEIIIRTQTDGIESQLDCVTVDTRDVENYWDMYRSADALLMPRRYAGLSLPVLEAFGAGLPVVMTDMSPQNTDWPVCTVPTTVAVRMPMMGGRIPTGDVDVRALATLMDRWAASPDVVTLWRSMAADYAKPNAWDIRAPQIRSELEEVADRVAA